MYTNCKSALRSGSSILSEVQTERWKLLIENYPNYPLRGLRSTRALSAAPEGAMNWMKQSTHHFINDFFSNLSTIHPFRNIVSVSRHQEFRSVVVITSPSHGEGPGFEPQRDYFVVDLRSKSSKLLFEWFETRNQLGLWRNGNASAYGAEDSRFDPWQPRIHFWGRMHSKSVETSILNNQMK